MANFDMAELALKSVAPSNKIVYDDKEMPSIMVNRPKPWNTRSPIRCSFSPLKIHPAAVPTTTSRVLTITPVNMPNMPAFDANV